MSHLTTKPTKCLCAQRRLSSAWASTQSDQPLLCAQWVAKDPMFLHADSKDSDQTGRTVTLLILPRGGSYIHAGALNIKDPHIVHSLTYSWESGENNRLQDETSFYWTLLKMFDSWCSDNSLFSLDEDSWENCTWSIYFPFFQINFTHQGLKNRNPAVES